MRRQGNRAGKHLVAGHFSETAVLALQRLATDIREKSGMRVTMQDMIAAGLSMVLKKYGRTEPPDFADAYLKLPASPNKVTYLPLHPDPEHPPPPKPAAAPADPLP